MKKRIAAILTFSIVMTSLITPLSSIGVKADGFNENIDTIQEPVDDFIDEIFDRESEIEFDEFEEEEELVETEFEEKTDTHEMETEIELESEIELMNEFEAEVQDYGICGLDVGYAYGEGILVIAGEGRMYDEDYYSKEYIPWYRYKHLIKKIYIEDGVTSIGDYAFCECSNLTTVDIADSVFFIGNNSFEGCGQLSVINLPKGISVIAYAKSSNIPYGIVMC